MTQEGTHLLEVPERQVEVAKVGPYLRERHVRRQLQPGGRCDAGDYFADPRFCPSISTMATASRLNVQLARVIQEEHRSPDRSPLEGLSALLRVLPRR